MTTDHTVLYDARAYVPEISKSEVAVRAPGSGPGYWSGCSSAVFTDGTFYMAYRVRGPLGQGRGYGNILAKSSDGVHFEQIGLIGKQELSAESLERPALIRMPSGRWRLYVSCATTGTKHWRVEMVEADDPASLAGQRSQVVLAGDEHFGVKDPVIKIVDGTWHVWATFHPLDEQDREDRMTTRYATSQDGLKWTWHGTVLSGRPGKWDSRGARLTAVVSMSDGRIQAFYDGRASAEENYEERTGLAAGTLDKLEADGDTPIAQSPEGRGLRYMDIVKLPDGRHRIYYECTRPDGAHDLRTQLVS